MNNNGDFLAAMGLKEDALKEIVALLKEENISEAVKLYKRRMKSNQREANIAVELIKKQQHDEQRQCEDIPGIEIFRNYPPSLSEQVCIKINEGNPAFQQFEDDFIICEITYPTGSLLETGFYNGKIRLEIETATKCFESLMPGLRKSFIRKIVDRVGLSECHVLVKIDDEEADFYPVDPLI